VRARNLSIDVQPPRGTRDFFPRQFKQREWLFDHWREVARLHGFQQYDAPVVESEALYVRKAGEEIADQIYAFQDKGNRRLALRPEMTPSLARMLISRPALPLPLKWFSIPQCWRYERMTRGRRREHFQWNMDIFGVSGTTAEVELLAALVSFFERIGLSKHDVQIRVSNRKVLEEVLYAAGVPADLFLPVCMLIDKADKIDEAELLKGLHELAVTDADTIARILGMLDATGLEKIQQLLEGPAKRVKTPAMLQLEQLLEGAAAYGIGEWLSIDCSIVRGLSYYTGTVFEVRDSQGRFRAICGGGRYDSLLSLYGGKDVPAAGFGFGDAVIVELLRDKNLLPFDDDTEAAGSVDVVVFSQAPEFQPSALQISKTLRSAGISVDLVLEHRKTKWAFKHANRAGASAVVMLAEEEMSQGQVLLKLLQTGTQCSVSNKELLSHLKQAGIKPRL